MRALPTLGGTHGFAAAANNLGQIVGWAENTVRDETCTPPQIFQFRAVVWGPNGNQIQELPVLGGDSSSAATAINDKGQIVGISGDCDDAIGSATAAHAVLWEDGRSPSSQPRRRRMEHADGDQREWRRRRVRRSCGRHRHRGVLLDRDGGLQGLGFLYADHELSEAFGMNDRRQVVGLSCGDRNAMRFSGRTAPCRT